MLHCDKQTTMDHIKRIWTSTDMLTLLFWSSNLKETSWNSVTFGFEGGKVVAWEKSRHLVTLPLVSPPNDWLVETNFPHGTTNQKHYPDLGSDASSETSGRVAKCQLFSQASKVVMHASFCNFSHYQVSSWGGYVFLINLIPLHVLALMATGRFSHRIYVAYCSVSTRLM